MDIFKGTLVQRVGGGTVTLKRTPVRDGWMHTSEETVVFQDRTSEFSVDALRHALSKRGYTLDDRSVHGVGYGKAFFFDFKVSATK